jgi:antitoxin component YwqK of YwqJK toxin-antitoxin module
MRYIIILISIISLSSCEPPKVENKKEESKVNAEDEVFKIDWEVEGINLGDVSDTVDNKLINVQDGIFLKDSIPFSGVGIEYYPIASGVNQIYLAVNYKNGIIQQTANFDKNGKRILRQDYYKGQPKSLNPNCTCSELTDTIYKSKKMKLRYDFPFTGECTKYYPSTSDPYEKHSYENGLLNGRSFTYRKNGTIIVSSKFRNNILIESQSFDENGLLIETIRYKNGKKIEQITH